VNCSYVALFVILEKHTDVLNISCNVNKTVYMVFQLKRCSQIVSESFPQLTLCSFYIKYVYSFRCLGHIILSNRMDNDDIQREVRNLFMRTNMLLRLFIKSSRKVKLVLFRSYCVCL